MWVRLKLSVTLRNFMECGGKRSATPLWLERLVLRWIWHKHKPKRRRASLAAALHMAVADTFNRTPACGARDDVLPQPLGQPNKLLHAHALGSGLRRNFQFRKCSG